MVVKTLEPMRVALLAEKARAFGDEVLGPIFARLYPRLHETLDRSGVRPAGQAVALYDESGDPEAPIRVMAAVPVGPIANAPEGVEMMELDPVPRAATTIHKGPMSEVEPAYEALVAWAEETGEVIVGFSRELYLDCDGAPERWVTELQFALGPRKGVFDGVLA